MLQIKKYLCLTFGIIMMAGCSNTVATTDRGESVDTSINQYKEQITKLELQIEKLEEENKEMSEQIKNQIDDQTSYKYYVDNYYYKEDEVQTMLGYKEYTGNEPLKALPYLDAIEVNSGSASGVKIISTVRNKYDERWALVEFCAHSDRNINNYGFVKLEYIEEKKDNSDHIISAIPLNIQGIQIGDLKEKAIAILGEDYVETRGFERGIIHYGEITEDKNQFYLGKGIDILYDTKTNVIWGIRIDDKNYKTSEGYGVGTNAIEAIEYYKSIYPMNGEVHFVDDLEDYKNVDTSAVGYWSFDVGHNYVLKLEIDTKELTKNSVITSIKLVPIWYFFT